MVIQVKETISEKDARIASEQAVQLIVDRDNKIKEEIRKLYSIDDEFKILNLGIADKTDPAYIKYRNDVTTIKDSL